MKSPDNSDTWLALTDSPLPTERASSWVVLPECGAVVVFSGTARDHSPGREGVSVLEYEAYTEQVEPRLEAIADQMRSRWDGIGRIAMLHRTGPVPVTESAVVVAVSAAHRPAAFEAARFGIDALKATVPIWKREKWETGSSWGLEAQHLEEIESLS